MAGHARRLRHQGGIQVAQAPTGLCHQRHYPAQQQAAVDIGIGGIRVREVPADIALANGPQQGVADGVDQHVAVGVGLQAAMVGDAHAAEYDLVASAEAVYIIAMTYSHRAALPCCLPFKRTPTR